MTPEERHALIQDIIHAVKSSTEPILSDDEKQWVKLAIQKEAQSIKLRNAIIEKTLSGLAWAAIVGTFYVFVEWAKSHGYRP